MKIRSISCTQFAGIRDQNLSFEEGINLVYGKNESGKSTLVNLLSRTLFQNARIDGRSDKAFKELYFPAARKDGKAIGDFADGRISFESDKGTYTLTKEWGSEPRCILSTPEAVLRDQKAIDAALKEVLLYGEGVYSELLFSSQRNTDLSLQTLLDASKKTDAKQEITNAVSQAFAESDGISVDAIEEAINKKIEEIAGKHWDVDKGQPARKAGRWAMGLGEILKAYYDLEDARAVLETITRLEKEADGAALAYTEKDEEVAAAEAAFSQFSRFAGQLTLQRERRKALERMEKEAVKLREVLAVWPRLAIDLESATVLKAEQENRQRLDQYKAAKKLSAEIQALEEEVAGRACPTEAELTAVKTSQRKIATLENKLCGMNLRAAIKLLGGNSLSITSLRTGEALELAEELSITEAVKISVPGVMEMELSPADVNVSQVEAELAEQRNRVSGILGRYGVQSLEALEQLAKSLSQGKAKMEALSDRLSLVLGTTDYAQLEAAAAAMGAEVRSKASIDADIQAVCGGSDLLRFITAKETLIQGYKEEYGSIEALKAKAYDLEQELKHSRDSLQAVEDLPVEYANISDPEGHLAQLQQQLKAKQQLREAALTAKTTAAGKLENYQENLSGDPLDAAETAERVFSEKKALLQHWLHIAEVFAREKEQLQNNPMEDIADSFTRYLGLISGGKISSEFPDPEKLSLNVYSGSSLLDYGKLSEGSKETVSLAFRLAVLDHLFPEGGGVLVLDDPFTDMDAERCAQSCQLLQDCAKRHQVIFLTCKEDYAKLLGGHEIRL